MTAERALTLPDGRTLLAFDAGPVDARATLIWHHGTPQTGRPLEPVVAAAHARDVRVVSYARPGYGSTARPGRDVASAAADTAAVVDTLAVQRFIAVGASGGGPHALANAALLGDRVSAVVCLAGIAPFTDTPAWWDGMVAPEALRAATAGRAARAAYLETEEFDPASFVDTDYAALAGRWRDLGADAGQGGQIGADGIVDDDVAFVSPWGFDIADVRCPALFVQGRRDRVVPPDHARLQATAVTHGEVWERPDAGHVAVLEALDEALDHALAAGG